jgi:D-lyxose ketol-isomerase
MVTKAQHDEAQRMAAAYFEKTGIVLTQAERESIEVADFGLDDLSRTGLELVTYINTARVCAKELILFPMQTCPEHMHPTIGGKPGKEETFRCRYGIVYLYVSGSPSPRPHCAHPEGVYTVSHEIVLRPGEQYTIYPETLHWFQAGPEGAVVSEFSTTSNDTSDIFSDPRIVRAPEVAE